MKSNLSNNSYSNQIRLVKKHIINYNENEEIDNDDEETGIKDEKYDENGTHDE